MTTPARSPEPRTKAGRQLHLAHHSRRFHNKRYDASCGLVQDILAIEAEAIALAQGESTEGAQQASPPPDALREALERLLDEHHIELEYVGPGDPPEDWDVAFYAALDATRQASPPPSSTRQAPALTSDVEWRDGVRKGIERALRYLEHGYNGHAKGTLRDTLDRARLTPSASASASPAGVDDSFYKGGKWHRRTVELLALLLDATKVQRTPCSHEGIGLPGCVTCDPRIRDNLGIGQSAAPAPPPSTSAQEDE